MTDRELITAVVRDYYYGGWYAADPSLMDRALHPNLVKRSSARLDGTPLRYLTKQDMVDATAAGEGKPQAGLGTLEIAVDDVSENIATVTVRGSVYHEYLHLVRTPDGWQIADALYRNVRPD